MQGDKGTLPALPPGLTQPGGQRPEFGAPGESRRPRTRCSLWAKLTRETDSLDLGGETGAPEARAPHSLWGGSL